MTPWRMEKSGVSGTPPRERDVYEIIDAEGNDIGGMFFEEEARQIITAVNAYEPMRTALAEIAKGEGPYSRDPLTHADNCIDAMKAIAVKVLGCTA